MGFFKVGFYYVNVRNILTIQPPATDAGRWTVTLVNGMEIMAEQDDIHPILGAMS